MGKKEKIIGFSAFVFEPEHVPATKNTMKEFHTVPHEDIERVQVDIAGFKRDAFKIDTICSESQVEKIKQILLPSGTVIGFEELEEIGCIEIPLYHTVTTVPDTDEVIETIDLMPHFGEDRRN